MTFGFQPKNNAHVTSNISIFNTNQSTKINQLDKKEHSTESSNERQRAYISKPSKSTTTKLGSVLFQHHLAATTTSESTTSSKAAAAPHMFKIGHKKRKGGKHQMSEQQL